MIILGNSFATVVDGVNTSIMEISHDITSYFTGDGRDEETVKRIITGYCPSAKTVSIPYEWYKNVQKSYMLKQELQQEGILLLSEQEVIYNNLHRAGKEGTIAVADFGKTTITLTVFEMGKENAGCEVSYIIDELDTDKKELAEILTARNRADLGNGVYKYLNKNAVETIERGYPEALTLSKKELCGCNLRAVLENAEKLNSYYFTIVSNRLKEIEKCTELVLCGNQLSLSYYFKNLENMLNDIILPSNIDIDLKIFRGGSLAAQPKENDYEIEIFTDESPQWVRLSTQESIGHSFKLNPKLCLALNKDSSVQLPMIRFGKKNLTRKDFITPKFSSNFEIGTVPVCAVTYEIHRDIFGNTIAQLTDTQKKKSFFLY